MSVNLRKQSGVSLLEVLISLLIIAFGALGLAKLQALTISDAATSGSRGLIALQASSLAALMRANPGYWQPGTNTTPATPVCFSNSGASSTCSSLSGSTAALATTNAATVFGTAPALSTCTYAAPCSASQIAALDMKTWMSNMATLVPNYTLSITCSNASGNSPTSCMIEISWSEKQQGINQNTSSLAATAGDGYIQQTYYQYVQP